MIVRTTVYDENLIPFEMATAYNLTNLKGAVADLNGKIEMRAAPLDKIVIQALGYKDEVFKAEMVPPVIKLKPKADDLPEVVLNYKKKTNWIKTTAIAAVLASLLIYYTNQN